MRYAHCMGVFTYPPAKLAHKRLVARLISGGFGFMRGSIAWLNYLYVHTSKCKMFHVEHFSILQDGESPAGHGPLESTCFFPAFLHLK